VLVWFKVIKTKCPIVVHKVWKNLERNKCQDRKERKQICCDTEKKEQNVIPARPFF